MSDISNATLPIEPTSASADGKRNSHSFGCRILQQTMSYAACLWRQQVLAHPGVKTPDDWSPCREAGRCGTCPANDMRKEEELAGKAIYFTERSNLRQRIEGARQWAHSTFGSAVSKRTPSPAPAAPVQPLNMLDGVDTGNDYADALSATAATEFTLKPTPAPIPPAPTSLPGESPLAMARRLAVERAAAQVS